MKKIGEKKKNNSKKKKTSTTKNDKKKKNVSLRKRNSRIIKINSQSPRLFYVSAIQSYITPQQSQANLRTMIIISFFFIKSKAIQLSTTTKHNVTQHNNRMHLLKRALHTSTWSILLWRTLLLLNECQHAIIKKRVKNTLV